MTVDEMEEYCASLEHEVERLHGAITKAKAAMADYEDGTAYEILKCALTDKEIA